MSVRWGTMHASSVKWGENLSPIYNTSFLGNIAVKELYKISVLLAYHLLLNNKYFAGIFESIYNRAFVINFCVLSDVIYERPSSHVF